MANNDIKALKKLAERIKTKGSLVKTSGSRNMFRLNEPDLNNYYLESKETKDGFYALAFTEAVGKDHGIPIGMVLFNDKKILEVLDKNDINSEMLRFFLNE